MMMNLNKPSATKDAYKAVENRERMYKQQLGEINNKFEVRRNQESQRKDYLAYIAGGRDPKTGSEHANNTRNCT